METFPAKNRNDNIIFSTLDVNYTEKFKKLLFRWSTQSETDVAGVGACNTDVPIKQGAKPLGNHKGTFVSPFGFQFTTKLIKNCTRFIGSYHVETG